MKKILWQSAALASSSALVLVGAVLVSVPGHEAPAHVPWAAATAPSRPATSTAPPRPGPSSSKPSTHPSASASSTPSPKPSPDPKPSPLTYLASWGRGCPAHSVRAVQRSDGLSLILTSLTATARVKDVRATSVCELLLGVEGASGRQIAIDHVQMGGSVFFEQTGRGSVGATLTYNTNDRVVFDYTQELLNNTTDSAGEYSNDWGTKEFPGEQSWSECGVAPQLSLVMGVEASTGTTGKQATVQFSYGGVALDIAIRTRACRESSGS